MNPMFDLFRQAQNGAAFDNLARAYGMSPERMRAAGAALSPAFLQGFQRQTASDQGARRFAEMFQTDAYARAFDAQAATLDPGARGAGEDALGALFGSKDVSRAVAAQAAAASGVQAEIIRKVLPTLASILVGGFMKAAQGAQGSGTAPAPGFPGPFGDVLGEMFGGSSGQDRKPSATAEGAPGNPFQPWIDAFSQQQGASQQPETPAAGRPANPMGEAMGDILNSMFGGAARTEQEPAPEEPRGNASRPGEPAGGTPFDDMAETGRGLSRQNAEAMAKIFDAFFGAKPGT